jgi:glycosyltransferase involved in cell wall biosynthesis
MQTSVQPRVSVVIPVYRRKDLLRKALLSLFAQDLPKSEFEIIVVDSSPDYENVALVNELASDAPCPIRCLKKKAEGPGPSRNLGFRNARGAVIAFMDSDCEATPGWLRQGLAAFGSGVGIVQGRTVPDPTARRGVFSYYLAVEQESFLYETANIFYAREALEQSGGFQADLTPNAETPMGSEDTEVAWTVIRRGWKTRFSSDAVVYHAVFKVSLWKWLFIQRLFCIPRLTNRFPELRRFMVYGYFFDRGQALFFLGLLGTLMAAWFPAALALCLPYAIFRASEPTKTLSGLLRPLRIAPYLARDTLSFFILSAGSLRYRSLLL